MNQLSIEVWLRVFRYLHTTDILYSFSNLNNRFQGMILTYQYDINLSDISIESCKRFIQHILPMCGPDIRSLTLKNNYQIDFCMQNKIFRSLSNLQCLKLKADPGNKTLLFFDFFSEHFIHLVRLIEFDLYNVMIYINDISSFVPPSLTRVSFRSANKSLAKMHIEHLRNIKVLTAYLRNSNELRSIESLQNLRELYLCALDLDHSDHVSAHPIFTIPNSLVKLHLEYREPEERTRSSFKMLKAFLKAFSKSLRSFTLIIDAVADEYADFNQFQTLSSCFSHLTSFQYFIHTSCCPSQGFDYVKKLPNDTYLIYTMKPRRPISYFELFKNDLSLYFTQTLNSRNLLALFPSGTININYRLPNLRHLSYSLFAELESSAKEDNLVISLLCLAPNLNSIQLDASTPEEILYFLKRMSKNRRKIDRFRCNCRKPLNSAFFFALSRYLPDLKYLHLNGGFFQKHIHTDGLQISKSVIHSIRRYFNNIIFVQFLIRAYNRHTSEKTDEYNKLIVWLKEHSKNLFYFEHLANDTELETHSISIWL